ncbi:MAG TPA: hypothetical protein VF101_04570 [Gaiellaceae bacterium]
MARLQAIFLYKTTGLWVRREALGASYSTERERQRVEVTLPASADDFLTWELVEGAAPYMAVGPPSTGTVDDPDQVVTVHITRMTVDFEADVDDPHEAFNAAQVTAESVLRSLLGWLRGGFVQPGLAVATEPLALVGMSHLVNLATGERLPYNPTVELMFDLERVETPLTPADVAAAWEQVEGGNDAPIAETLLADAEHFAWGEAPDPVRAVLAAAIACEVKVKRNLRERVHPDRADLLDFILENPREITVTAADTLFDKVMKITQGRSLRDSDRSLFREIKRLFEIRNAVAHRGEVPSITDARTGTKASRQTFAWLDAPAA